MFVTYLWIRAAVKRPLFFRSRMRLTASTSLFQKNLIYLFEISR